MKTLDVIKTELKKEYPSGIVNNLKQTNNDLYTKLRSYAKENNASIKEILEQNDFIYLRKSIIRMYVDDFIDLEKAYPEFKIQSFYENNNKLYYRVLSHAKSMKTSLKNYLNSLGFEYIAREDISDNSIIEELTKLYPNKKVEKLSAKNSKLYYRIYQLAKKENMEMNQYIEKLGFSIDETPNNKEKTNSKTEDKKNVKKANTTRKKSTRTIKNASKKSTNTKKTQSKTNKTTTNTNNTSQNKSTKRGRKPKNVKTPSSLEKTAEQ